MSTSEIAKLESRWRENPSGLTFAPLAEAYRKQKDPQRALEILLPGLEKHPDYIPANIVLGRCHLDLNDLPAAELAFTHVLGLDGENVIALKALADITERLTRYDEAERWLETLLAVDRSNDEARAQLDRVHDLQRQQAEPSAAVPGASEVAEPPAEAGASARVALEEPPPEAAVVEEPIPAPEAFEPAPEPPGVVEAASIEYIGWVARPDDLAATAAPLPVEDLELPPPPDAAAPEPPVEPPLEPAVTTAEPSAPFAPPPVPDFDAFGVEQREEIVLNVSGQTEYQTPSAVDDLMAQVTGTPPGIDGLRRDLAPEEPITSALPGFKPRSDDDLEAAAPEAEDADRTEPEPTVASLFGRAAEFYALEDPAETMESTRVDGWDESEAEHGTGAAHATSEPPASEAEPGTADVGSPAGELDDAPGVGEPELVVTETMAEVFLRQGHLAEAITVYRELVRRGPAGEHLTGRLAELETRHAAASAPAPRPAYAARDTGGQSVAGLFQAMLSARPTEPPPRWPARPEPAAETEPPEAASATRPAGEPLSLGSVFGEEPPPVAPAVGRPSGETAAPGTAAPGSFDDFFGTPAKAAAPSQPPTKGRPVGRTGDDLDQFHAWLQGLKR
jgi:tetratricopeptide (TPR) repeat protein